MKTVLSIMGLSGAGKTTMARKFAEGMGFHHLHCIQPFKDHLEYVFNLPKGSLSNQHGKKACVPGTNTTFQQIMVDYFEFWVNEEHGGGIYGAMSTKAQILQSSSPFIVVDSIRNLQEAQMLKDLVDEGKIEVDLIQLENPRARREVSDRHLWDNIETIQTFCRFNIVFGNTAPLEESFTRLKRIYCELLADEW